MSETILPNENTTNRSNLYTGAAMVAGVAAISLLAAKPARAVDPPLTFNDIPGTGDIKVLNYALALEALEADVYRQALGRLTNGFTNASGVNIPGLGLSASEPDVQYATSFGRVEAEHRDFLNTALGSASILQGALQNAQFDFNFTATTTRQQVIELLYTIENLGTQAYLGAIKFFATKNFLLQAGAIQATEARHTAVIAAIFNQLFGATKFTAPLAGQSFSINGSAQTAGIDGTAEPNDVLAAASPFILLPS
jgi:hypothetical protein